MRPDAEARRSTLYAGLGFCQLTVSPDMPEIAAFQQSMMTWPGIGNIVTGIERQGYALALRKLVDDGWNAAWEQHCLLAPVATASSSGQSSSAR